MTTRVLLLHHEWPEPHKNTDTFSSHYFPLGPHIQLTRRWSEPILAHEPAPSSMPIKPSPSELYHHYIVWLIANQCRETPVGGHLPLPAQPLTHRRVWGVCIPKHIYGTRPWTIGLQNRVSANLLKCSLPPTDRIHFLLRMCTCVTKHCARHGKWENISHAHKQIHTRAMESAHGSLSDRNTEPQSVKTGAHTFNGWHSLPFQLERRLAGTEKGRGGGGVGWGLSVLCGETHALADQTHARTHSR